MTNQIMNYTDIWIEIFSYLPYQEIITNLSVVCKQWNYISTITPFNSIVLSREILHKYRPDDIKDPGVNYYLTADESGYFGWLYKFTKNLLSRENIIRLTHLEIESVDGFYGNHYAWPMLYQERTDKMCFIERLTMVCRSLEKVNLPYLSGYDMGFLARNPIEYLRLEGGFYGDASRCDVLSLDMSQQILASMQHLTCLHLVGVTWRYHDEPSRKLHLPACLVTLVIDDIYEWVDNENYSTYRDLPGPLSLPEENSLGYVSIDISLVDHYYDNVWDSTFFESFSNCLNLKKLIIWKSRNTVISTEAVQRFKLIHPDCAVINKVVMKDRMDIINAHFYGHSYSLG
eukprot:TRINITY_DN6516_c0_g1_i1.p1 TRINITY_DN6516_c0_g1~~TRINITY_DN6516_c0_g1_i1.p1  ORF type:complete len:373 (-),score=42.78 TRINITY_DN6516_c0_g1_i1:79-1110(-)